ncbi:histidinol-phosphate aminotransferase [Limnochorda pilosa]|uniref:Histidinol-phosphate aminotransferase n=1 Tax=Limnochorda pilosa TaxID=1555112 RepID=A0A0K2SKJ5_LIMPI|nr:histidinol-phosphate aminotransferase [Limnochorda pilosa]
MEHVYLREAVTLRPDRAAPQPAAGSEGTGAPPLRPEAERITPYQPGRSLEEVRRELGLSQVVKLASNENPLGPSPRALEVLARPGFLEGLHRYPDGSFRLLREALGRRHGVDPEQVVVGNGSDELLKLLGEAYLQPGDEVVMGSPSFSEYSYVARLLGAREVPVPVSGGQVRAEDVLAAVTPRTRLLFLATPNNPTGTALEPAELERLEERLPGGVVVALDEAYREYVRPERLFDSLGPVRRGRPWISLRTFSKIYGLAGLRVGYGLAAAPVAQAIMRVKEPFNVNQAAQAAALAALEDEEHVRRSRELVWNQRAWLVRELERRGLRCDPSDANFVLVRLGRADGPVAENLLHQGVIVRPGVPLGVPGAIRVTVGLPRENLLFLEALDRALAVEPVPAERSGGGTS